jgi:predicted nucleotide-binding protein
VPGLFGLFQSNNQVDIANANLQATKLQQEALIKQYELQYQTKLTDAQKQELLNEQAKQQADADQKRTQTYILGGIGAMVVGGILYAILRK